MTKKLFGNEGHLERGGFFFARSFTGLRFPLGVITSVLLLKISKGLGRNALFLNRKADIANVYYLQ